MKISPFILLAAVLLLQCAMPAASAANTAPIALSMPEQPLRDALNGLARQTGLQVIYTADDVGASMRAPRIEGTYTPQAALDLLLKNSGLYYEFLNSRTVAVSTGSPAKASSLTSTTAWRESETAGGGAASSSGRASRLTLAQADSPEPSPRAQATSSGSDTIARKNADGGDTVVVTGTHIRGATSSASPMMTFTRDDIQRSGASSTQAFIKTLPQNYGGGYSETTVGGILGGEGSNLNFGMASGANLRGLGPDATLTLLNGRRVAPTSVGESVDLSVIPLSAIERIDVLTDGASAIYGSDAVSGVINIVLRREYSGAETNLYYGNVTSGSNDERKASQTFGRSWDGGHALIAYEFTDRKQLQNTERDFAAGALFAGVELIPPNKQHSAVLSFAQALTPKVELFGDAVYSKRDTSLTFFSGGDQYSPISSDQISGGAGLRFGVGSNWQAEVASGYSKNNSFTEAYVNGARQSQVEMNSNVWSADAKIDGDVFSAPAGAAKLALGTQFRHETFQSTGVSANSGAQDKRDIKAIFAELLVPLVGPGNARPGMQRLELSFAGRYEDYSDVGATEDPKVGVLWSPVAGLNLRGTYGTSFRAPSFYEQNTTAAAQRPIAYTIADPLPGQPARTVTVIVISGNTGTLKPETATNWTFGFDLKPESLPGFSLSATYFSIEFTDRVAEPLAIPAAFQSMLIEEAQHPDIVQRNPPLALVNSYLAHPLYRSFAQGPVVAAQVAAIVDNRRVNVASTEERGMDFGVTYDLDRGAGGMFSFQVGGSYLFEKDNRFTDQSPLLSNLNALFVPVDFRMRNSAGWSRDRFGATLFWNYVDSYKDVRPGFQADVASFTTFDLTARYAFADRLPWLKGTTLFLAANNVLDKAPPYINYFGFNFDPTNASALGRYLSLSVTKAW